MERLILLQLMLLGHVTAFTYYKPTVALERNNFIFNGHYGVDQPLEIGSLSELKAVGGDNDVLTTEAAKETDSNDGEELSDLDARILESLLSENLDLATEERYKTVLRRSNDAKLRREKEERNRAFRERAEEFVDKEYSSSIFKAVMNWDSILGSIRAKAGEVLESVALSVRNRVERDLKVSISLGLFALDRAVKDSGRTLGAAKERTVFLLTETSSFEDLKPNITKPSDIMDEIAKVDLNTPMNEIKEVSETIIDILKGEDNSNERTRTLKSFAPVGTSRNAERLRKAYKQRKETIFKREQEGIDAKIGRAASSITDAAWEMKNEMSSLENKPGYRSENLRQAIGSSSVGVIGGKVFQNILPNFKQGDSMPQIESGGSIDVESSEPITVNVEEDDDVEAFEEESLVEVDYFDEFLKERTRYSIALRLCLESPEQTWLSKNIVNEVIVEEESLGAAITSMIFTRDDLEAEIDESYEMSFYFVIKEFEKVEKSLDDLCALVASAVGIESAKYLEEELLDGSEWTSKSMVAHKQALDSVLKKRQVKKEAKKTSVKKKIKLDLSDNNPQAAFYRSRPNQSKKEENYFYAESTIENSSQDVIENTSQDDVALEPRVIEAEMINAEIDIIKESKSVDSQTSSFVDSVEAETINAVEVETIHASTSYSDTVNVDVIIDDDNDDNFVDIKSVSIESEPIDEEPTPAFVVFTLRSIDIIFFILEKTIKGVPRIIVVGTKILSKVDKVNKGSDDIVSPQGWKVLENVKSGSNRY